MNKSVAINILGTPEENNALALSMIGQVIEPQTRWTPGALANSVLDAASVPTALIISALSFGVLAVEGVSGSTVVDGFDTAFLAATGHVTKDRFTAESSTTKSKLITTPTVSVPVLLIDFTEPDGAAETHPMFQILAAKRPTFTVSSLVNGLENALIANGDNYVILVDQVSESVTVYLFSSAANAAAFASAVVTTPPVGDRLALFDTTFEAPSAGVPSFGWE